MYAKGNKMNNYQRLIELLEKENFSPEDENYISELCAGDHEAEKIVRVYNKLKQSNTIYKIITFKQLSDYVLYLNGQEPIDKNIITLIPEIEKQLRISNELKKEFEFLNAEFSEAAQYVTNTFTISGKSKKNDLLNTLRNLNGFKKYSLYSISATSFVYLFLLIVLNIFTPDYKNDIILQDTSDNGYTRGRISESFQQGLIYINNNDLQKAIDMLNKDISINPDGRTIFYSHYVLGMVHLQNSKSNLLGLFTSYNESDLQKGIHELNLAVKKNTNPQFKNINLNAYFFIGNAYLALDSIQKAKPYFEIVTKEKGAFMKHAEILLESIHGNR